MLLKLARAYIEGTRLSGQYTWTCCRTHKPEVDFARGVVEGRARPSSDAPAPVLFPKMHWPVGFCPSQMIPTSYHVHLELACYRRTSRHPNIRWSGPCLLRQKKIGRGWCFICSAIRSNKKPRVFLFGWQCDRAAPYFPPSVRASRVGVW